MHFNEHFRRPDIAITTYQTPEHIRQRRERQRAVFFTAIAFPKVVDDATVQLGMHEILAYSLETVHAQEIDTLTRNLSVDLHLDRADRNKDNTDRLSIALRLCRQLVIDERSTLSYQERSAVLDETIVFLTGCYAHNTVADDLRKYTAFITAFQDMYELFTPEMSVLQNAIGNSSNSRHVLSWKTGLAALHAADFNKWHYRALYPKRKVQ